MNVRVIPAKIKQRVIIYLICFNVHAFWVGLEMCVMLVCMNYLDYSFANILVDINECEGVSCQNDASCDNRIGYFFCNCNDAFSGTLCETQKRMHYL
jgi:hypothetical protein